MKPSHLRTPRTLAECYFVEGSNTVEPAQWAGNWNRKVKEDNLTVSFLQWKIFIPLTLLAIVIGGFVVRSFI